MCFWPWGKNVSIFQLERVGQRSIGRDENRVGGKRAPSELIEGGPLAHQARRL